MDYVLFQLTAVIFQQAVLEIRVARPQAFSINVTKIYWTIQLDSFSLSRAGKKFAFPGFVSAITS